MQKYCWDAQGNYITGHRRQMINYFLVLNCKISIKSDKNPHHRCLRRQKVEVRDKLQSNILPSILHVFSFFFFPSLVQCSGLQNPNTGQRGVGRQKSSLFTSCKQTDLCWTEFPSCTILQSVNLFMEKGIQQYTTGGRYVYIYCNDQGRSVLLNAISEENGLKSTLCFILKQAGIPGRLCQWLADLPPSFVTVFVKSHLRPEICTYTVSQLVLSLFQFVRKVHLAPWKM